MSQETFFEYLWTVGSRPPALQGVLPGFTPGEVVEIPSTQSSPLSLDSKFLSGGALFATSTPSDLNTNSSSSYKSSFINSKDSEAATSESKADSKSASNSTTTPKRKIASAITPPSSASLVSQDKIHSTSSNTMAGDPTDTSRNSSSTTATAKVPKANKGVKLRKSGDKLGKISTPNLVSAPAPEPAAPETSEESDEDEPTAKKQFTHWGNSDNMLASVEFKPRGGNKTKLKAIWLNTHAEIHKRITPAVQFRDKRSWAKNSTLYQQEFQMDANIQILTVRAIGPSAKAVFTNPTSPLFCFLWGLMPCGKEELEASNYHFLRFIAHTPVIGPLPSSTVMPLLKGLTIPNAPREKMTKVQVSNVLLQGVLEDNWGYHSGNFVVQVPNSLAAL
ncbi:hypothetical protein PTTG_01629 [Puccinia triticina 1-1 BBBD Race 1]|uniref:Uncharacterized protein n=1 Tax=Puccinia triticina (isolate 1-1 / race 1 (BBBD)) TaxID=630390 RepID=A0A180GR09_PUCT1|nr:hypothetical protein PTTG_01629 [Puccinia triticina 1-1 BBBD Race 1]